MLLPSITKEFKPLKKRQLQRIVTYYCINIGDIEVFRIIDTNGREMYQLHALLFEDWSCLPGAVSTPNNQDALASLNSNVELN